MNKTADLIIPAHVSAKNNSLLGGRLLPMYALKTAQELRHLNAVERVIVVSDIQEVLETAPTLNMETVEESADLAAEEQLAVVCAKVAEIKEITADHVMILTPNVPFREANILAKFLSWSMGMEAESAWTCEKVPCNPEMILLDHTQNHFVNQAIPDVELKNEQQRLVLGTGYGITAKVSSLIENKRLRDPLTTRLYQMPKGHITWTLESLSDFQWAERMLEE